MKKFLISIISFSTLFAGCDDFFQPETADALSGDDYMSSLTEMSTGYLGILTKMQAVGDKEIYLTDTRGEMLEPTDQSIAELIALYNYDDDLTGNSYADPAPYYDVVIACNDYLHSMLEFKANYPEVVAETEYFDGLFASAIRVKVWAYMTLAEIYGQAMWFDDPITSIKDVNDTRIFTRMNAAEVVEQCIALLKNGYQGYSAKETFSWIAWIDPSNVSSISSSPYRYWDMMTPSYEPLMGKLQVWNGACLEAKGQADLANAAYEDVLDNLLPFLQNYWAQFSHYWKRCPTTPGHYSAFWNNASPYQEEVVGAIIYDYTKNQTNHLLYHFSNEYPNHYLLRPNEVARDRFYDKEFTPMTTVTVDPRLGSVAKEMNGAWCICKYRPNANVRANAYQDDVHIYTFRVSELFLWVAEALNHLGRYEAMDRVMNNGFAAADYDMLLHLQNGEEDQVTPEQAAEYKGFNSYWAIPTSVDKYGTYSGFRGCLSLASINIWTEASHTAEEARRHNDELLANEWMLDFACEGKVYPNLIRFAERYADPAIVADRVTPKYGEKASAIASKISSVNAQSGLMGYYVPWAL